MKKNEPSRNKISHRDFLSEVPAVAGLAVAAFTLPNPLLAADFNAAGSALGHETETFAGQRLGHWLRERSLHGLSHSSDHGVAGELELGSQAAPKRPGRRMPEHS